MRTKGRGGALVIPETINFEQMVHDYGRLVFTICYTMTHDYFEAEDLAQETFLAAARNLERFQGDNPKAWLTTIAANKCRDYRKSAARRIAPSEDSVLETLEHFPSPEKEVENACVEEHLYCLCQTLKEPYRQVAIQYFCHQKSSAEIAKELGINPKTIQTRIYRARGMLKSKWKEDVP